MGMLSKSSFQSISRHIFNYPGSSKQTFPKDRFSHGLLFRAIDAAFSQITSNFLTQTSWRFNDF